MHLQSALIKKQKNRIIELCIVFINDDLIKSTKIVHETNKNALISSKWHALPVPVPV